MTDPESNMRDIVEALLAPDGADAFLADSYGRRAMRFAAADPARFVEYVRIEEIEALMRAPGFFDTLSVALRLPGQDGHSFATRPADVYDTLSRNGAIQFVGIESVLPDTHPLVRSFNALGAFIGARPQKITVFLSPPGEALPVHKDPLEVFTLQATGRKTWRLFDFHAPAISDETIDPDAAPAETIRLEPGDLLYVPKGQAHRVEAGEGLSITASLVYVPPTWTKLFDLLGEKIADDRDFWAALPPEGVEANFETMRAKLAAALGALDPSEFAERIAAERAGEARSLPADHVETALAVASFGPKTLVRRRPGPAPLARSDEAHAYLVSAHDDPIRAPLDAFDAFRFIADTSAPFRIEEMCERLSASSKLAVARKLARRGILQLAPESGDETAARSP